MVLYNNELWQKPATGATGIYSYQIEQSLRFDFADDSYMNFSPSTATSRDVMTWSFWFKFGGDPYSGGQENILWTAGTGGGAGQYSFMEVRASDRNLTCDFYNLGIGATDVSLVDPSSWYHIVMRYNSNESTQIDRLKIWLNGRQITISSNSISSGEDFPNWNVNNMYIGNKQNIGHAVQGTNFSFAEWIFVDGTAYDETQFGEFKNNIWVPKDPSGTSFGNNGFHLKFASGAFGTDSSGNGNTWSTNNIGTDHTSIDTPTSGGT